MSALNESELQEPRTAATLLPWALQRLDEIGATREGKSRIRLRKGLEKHLIEEVYPLGIFSDWYYSASSEVVIRFVLGSQNYDAVVDDGRTRPAPIDFVEVTQAREGEAEHLRALQLERVGRVPAFGPLTKTGTKKTGITIEAKSRTTREPVELLRQLELLRNAVLRKRARTYPPRTALVIAFDDAIGLRSADGLSAVAGCLAVHSAGWENVSLVAAVGWSGRTCVISPTHTR